MEIPTYLGEDMTSRALESFRRDPTLSNPGIILDQSCNHNVQPSLPRTSENADRVVVAARIAN
jgi:hypothetical protein